MILVLLKLLLTSELALTVTKYKKVKWNTNESAKVKSIIVRMYTGVNILLAIFCKRILILN